MAIFLLFKQARRSSHQPLYRGRNSRKEQALARHSLFWEEHPALLFAISYFVGLATYLFESPAPLIWILYLLFLKKPMQLLLIAGGFFYAYFLFSPFPTLGEPRAVKARFEIHSLKPHRTPFERGLLYTGTLDVPEGALPCTIFLRGHTHPEASHDYLIEGLLKQKDAYTYALKPKTWEIIPKSFSFAELRYTLKEKTRRYLAAHLAPKPSEFLGSLITGDVASRELRYEFGKLGLQHILAVSGFHFGTLIAFISFLTQFFLPKRIQFLSLAFASTLYFFAIGDNPSIFRAFIAVSLYLLAKFLNRIPSGLNLLGFAALFETTLHPLTALNLGFQFSYAAAAGILLLFRPAEKFLQRLFPKRTQDELLALDLASKQIALLASFLRKSFALTFAVTIPLLPILLYYFHTFPLLSLFYNLFFPFLTGGVLFLLLFSLLATGFFMPLASLLFALTSFLTSRLLDLTSYPPHLLDFSLRFAHLPGPLLPLFLFTLLILSIQNTYNKHVI